MRKILLLNNGGDVMDIISWPKAIKLIMRGKAKACSYYEDVKLNSDKWIKMYHIGKLPSVIMLVNYVFIPYSKRVPLNKKNIFLRDKGFCAYCGKSISLHNATIDHIIPISRGGKNDWKNCVLACKHCNNRKADHLINEIKMVLRVHPYTPKKEQFFLCYIDKETYSVWKDYLNINETELVGIANV